MKKIFGIMLMILLISGCNKLTKEEAKKVVLDSLEDAYASVYIADGVGLAVYADEKIEENGVTWYKVAGNYTTVDSLYKIAENAYKGDALNELKSTIDEKYKDINGALYTKSSGGCALPYELETSREKLDEITTIEKIKSNKIIIKVNNKEYTLSKKNDNWVSEDKIFSCE